MCSLSICTRLLCLQVLQRAVAVPSIALCTFILCKAFAAWQPANVGFHLGYHRNKLLRILYRDLSSQLLLLRESKITFYLINTIYNINIAVLIKTLYQQKTNAIYHLILLQRPFFFSGFLQCPQELGGEREWDELSVEDYVWKYFIR